MEYAGPGDETAGGVRVETSETTTPTLPPATPASSETLDSETLDSSLSAVVVEVEVPPKRSTKRAKRSFGGQLRVLRESVGLTQRVLYILATGDEDAKTGPVTAISHWEDGRRTPPPSQLLRLVRVLHGLQCGPLDRALAGADRPKIPLTACWELVLLAAAEHHRYAGFLAMVPRDMDIDQRWAMYASWAGTFPEREER